jgi:hypothetical protein
MSIKHDSLSLKTAIYLSQEATDIKSYGHTAIPRFEAQSSYPELRAGMAVLQFCIVAKKNVDTNTW